jgi:hypothetical protein
MDLVNKARSTRVVNTSALVNSPETLCSTSFSQPPPAILGDQTSICYLAILELLVFRRLLSGVKMQWTVSRRISLHRLA